MFMMLAFFYSASEIRLKSTKIIVMEIRFTGAGNSTNKIIGTLDTTEVLKNRGDGELEMCLITPHLKGGQGYMTAIC
jgi:hypothetical protein